jgi:hypothetical protein
MELSELLKSLLKPEYVPMLAIAIALVKILVPLVRELIFKETNAKGYTSLKVAFVLSTIISFGIKILQKVGSWSGADILMTLIVAVIAALTAIGLNVTIQATKGSDVSITR